MNLPTNVSLGVCYRAMGRVTERGGDAGMGKINPNDNVLVKKVKSPAPLARRAAAI